jgi:CRISPR system Cascade subunit CasB
MSTASEDPVARFVASLEKLVETENRGALAALRRGLGKPPGSAPEMHRLIVPYLSHSLHVAEENRFYLLGSLFAYWHQGAGGGEGEPPHNLGESLAVFQQQDSGSDSVEKRFEALLNAHADDLPTHLRHMVGLLRGKNIAVNWGQLLRDLRNWDHPDRFVQRQWARAFWSKLARDTATADTQASPDDAVAEE